MPTPPKLTGAGELGKVTTDFWHDAQDKLRGVLGDKATGLTTDSALAVTNYLNSGGRDPSEIQNMLAGGMGVTDRGEFDQVGRVAGQLASQWGGYFDSIPTQNLVPKPPEPKPEEAKPAEETPEEMAKRLISERNTLLDKLTELQTTKAGQSWGEQYGQLRGAKIKEQTALGRITEPTGQETINKSDIAAQKSLKDIIGQIQEGSLREKSGFAASTLPTILGAKTSGEQLGLQKATLAEQIRQFNESVREKSLGRMQSAEEAARNESLAERLGRMQAEANQPGTLDKVKTGIAAGQLAINLWRTAKGM